MIPGPPEQLAETIRLEGRYVLATLVRTLGSLQLAEDAVQDAAVAALRTWPRTGIPADPRSWLLVTARNKAYDALRREAARPAREAAAWRGAEPAADPAKEVLEVIEPDSAVRDDLLRLVFTCCHPALAREAQVALALRTFAGLDVAAIARAFLVPERADLETEAVRMARLVCEFMPGESEVLSLLALLLFTSARRRARTDGAGSPVLLADQDRARWDHPRIAEASALLAEAVRRSGGVAGPYQLQAHLAACHCTPPRWADTDWDRIIGFYDLLLRLAASPAVALNRAVAVGERDGPAALLAALDKLDGLSRSHLWHVAQALDRLGRGRQARAELQQAIDLAPTGPDRRLLAQRLASLAPRRQHRSGP